MGEGDNHYQKLGYFRDFVRLGETETHSDGGPYIRFRKGVALLVFFLSCIIFVVFVCVWGGVACMSVCALCEHSSAEAGGGTGSPGTGVTDGGELPCLCCALTPGPLDERHCS